MSELEPELVYVGKRFVVKSADFSTGYREWITPGDCVAVLPYTDNDFTLAVQFREATGRLVTSLCAGMIDPGEVPMTAARRELDEELGLHSGEWEYVGCYYSSEGISDERTYFFLVKDAKVNPNATIDYDEGIEIETRPITELQQTIDNCSNAKAMIALQYLQVKLLKDAARNPTVS